MEHSETITNQIVIDFFQPSVDARATTAHYGKTFYFASLFMGETHAEPAFRLYEVCRRLDDIADEYEGDATSILNAIKTQLQHDSRCDYVSVDELVLPTMALEHMIDGMLADQHNPELATQDELIRYCYQVAGTVGLMMCQVMGVTNKKALRHAIDLGIAMQLTNIARDVYEDACNQRRYIPSSWVNNLSPQAIKSSESVRVLQQGQARLVELADAYYESGFAGLHYLPKKVRYAIYVAASCYREIGMKVIRPVTWKSRAHVSLLNKVWLSGECFLRYQRNQQGHGFTALHNYQLHQALTDYVDLSRITL